LRVDLEVEPIVLMIAPFANRRIRREQAQAQKDGHEVGQMLVIFLIAGDQLAAEKDVVSQFVCDSRTSRSGSASWA
jgi:hypothetical protein